MNSNLRKGHTNSCGCLLTEMLKTLRLIHGHHRKGKSSGTYISWCGMKARCNNPKNNRYYRYGKIGIKVCPEWDNSFECFLKDMGERPDGLTIERIDGALGYFKSNCYWGTDKEQARNKSNNRIVTVRGITGCLAELCERFGKRYGLVMLRLRRGWTPERAFFEPVHKH